MAKINRQLVYDTFADYTSKYNAQDPKIKLKIDHTYRVAALSEQIAVSLKMTEEETDLAWLIGMLHDVGRFEQLRRYGTFSDADSIDHAQFGVQLLFEEGLLENYLLAKQQDHHADGWREIIWKAIGNHSAYRIEKGLDQRTRTFCQIIRDADKIDILKVNHDVPLEDIYNVTTQQLCQAQVTPEVMDAFFERHAVLRSLKKTPVDHIVGHAALVFELVYPASYRLVKQQGYLAKILDFPSDNPTTVKQFKQLRECMEGYMQEQLGSLSFDEGIRGMAQ